MYMQKLEELYLRRHLTSEREGMSKEELDDLFTTVCNGQCQCCVDTSECYLLKGGEDESIKEGKFIKDDKCKYQDRNGAWQESETKYSDCYE